MKKKGIDPKFDFTIKTSLAVLACVLLFIDVLRFFDSEELGWRLLLFVIILVFSFDYVKLSSRQSANNLDQGRRRVKKSLLLDQVNEEQNDLEEAKAQFIISTQHHLRGPLTVIQGYLSLVLDGAYGRINEKARAKIKASLDETQKMIKVVNEFFDVVKYRMDKSVPQKTEVDIPAMIKEIITDLLAYARANDLYLDIEEVGMPAPKIQGDCAALKEAFFNIIDNAIKYTEEGGVKVKIEAAGDHLEVVVSDTGVGLEEQEKKDIFFKTFHRGKGAWKANTAGKGIGLYLAAQTIARHDGSIRVESDGHDCGSAFYIWLPVETNK